MPQFFEVSDKLSLLRADKLGDEFGIQFIMKGSGDEYQRIEEIKNSGASIIASLNFPKAFDVEDPYAAMLVSLEDMKHWEQAPANLTVLQNNEIEFAISSYDLKDKKAFWTNIRKAIAHGLSEENALKALTYTPASMIGMAFTLYSNGLVETTIVRATLLYYLTPIWSTLLGVIWLSEPLTKYRIIAIAVAFAGLILLLSNGNSSENPLNIGDLYSFLSGIFWAIGAVRGL